MLSLAGIESEITRLQAAIKENRDKAKELTDQKTSAAAQGDDLQQKSTGEKGRQSVDDFVAGADVHKKAADVGIEVDKLDAAVAPMQADLDMLQTRQAGVKRAIDGYNKRSADLDSTWKATQDDIAAQKRVIAEIAGGAGGAAPEGADKPEKSEKPAGKAAGNNLSEPLPPPPAEPKTVAETCTVLKGLLTETADLRDKAAKNLKDAVKAFNDEAKAADALRTDISKVLGEPRTSPSEKLAYQQLQETYSGAAARLAAANADRSLALSYAAEAITGQDVKKTLEGLEASLGGDAPASIQDALAAAPKVEETAQLADERFKDALDHYQNLIAVQASPGVGSEGRKNAAMAGKMVAAFGAKQLSHALNDRPVVGLKASDFQGMIDDVANQLATSKDPALLPRHPLHAGQRRPDDPPRRRLARRGPRRHGRSRLRRRVESVPRRRRRRPRSRRGNGDPRCGSRDARNPGARRRRCARDANPSARCRLSARDANPSAHAGRGRRRPRRPPPTPAAPATPTPSPAPTPAPQ